MLGAMTSLTGGGSLAPTGGAAHGGLAEGGYASVAPRVTFGGYNPTNNTPYYIMGGLAVLGLVIWAKKKK